jgi:hypothetical protein
MKVSRRLEEHVAYIFSVEEWIKQEAIVKQMTRSKVGIFTSTK